MVIVRLVAVKVVVVLAISVDVANPSVDDCHLTTAPVWPLRVSVVELVPVQTLAVPATEPPTEARLTVTVADALFAVAQLPLCTTARY